MTKTMKNPHTRAYEGEVLPDIVVNEETGLPVLPEGLFWVVEESHKGSEYLSVIIAKNGKVRNRNQGTWQWAFGIKNMVSGAEEVERTIINKLDVSSDKIFDSACRVLAEYTRKLRKAETAENWAKFVGEYPPKVLGE